MSSSDLKDLVSDMDDSERQELRLWLKMLSTTRMVSQEIRRRLRREFQSTLPQFDLLAQLYREVEGLRLGELSTRTMVTNGNITGLIERLEKEGLVVRERLKDDRRVSVATITTKGRKTFEKMAEAHEGWLRDIMSDVQPAAIHDLLVRLGDVKQSAQNHISEN